jgi:Amt family ammonium transporter
MAVMWVVNAIGLPRVSPEGETVGLDLHDHGISAYPEYVITAVVNPAAAVLEPSGKLGHHAAVKAVGSNPGTVVG